VSEPFLVTNQMDRIKGAPPCVLHLQCLQLLNGLKRTQPLGDL